MESEAQGLHERYRGLFWIVLKEYVFVLIPFLVSAYFSLRSGVYAGFFRQSEWAMASVGLIAQILLKFLNIYGSPFAKNKNIISLCFVFVISDLIFSVLILHDVMLLGDGVFSWVIVLQVLFFLLNSFVYFVFSMVSGFYDSLE